MHPNRVLWAAVMIMAVAGVLPARAQDRCPAPAASTSVNLPDRPYAAIASPDGCKIFVSTQGASGGLALVEFRDGNYDVSQTIALTIRPAGLALSHDGSLLVAPGADGIAFVDAEKFQLLATLDDGGKGPIMARITDDDKTLFVSDEMSNRITVIDLERARATGFNSDAIVATIATGRQPVGLALSPDQRFLYAAVEIGNSGEPVCKDGARAGAAETPAFPQGTLTIIDTAQRIVVAELPAGCRPIRAVLSSDGKKAYVSARGSSEIIEFDTEMKTRLSALKLPAAAFGIALSGNDTTLFASTGQTLSIIDTGEMKIIDAMPTNGSARDMMFLKLDNKGSVLLLTNGGSSTLDIIRPRTEAVIVQ